MLSHSMPVTNQVQTLPSTITGSIRLTTSTAMYYYISEIPGEFKKRKATFLPCGVVAFIDIPTGSYISYVNTGRSGLLQIKELTADSLAA